MLLNQCQAPVTGLDEVSFIACSIVFRAEDFTGLVKTTTMGIATPTVDFLVGTMLSSSMGGPDGYVLVGLGDGLAEPEEGADVVAAVDPAEADPGAAAVALLTELG